MSSNNGDFGNLGWRIIQNIKNGSKTNKSKRLLLKMPTISSSDGTAVIDGLVERM